MSYFGQKDYTTPMGIKDKKTIAQDGSFLVAQSNLLQKFGFTITPPALDDIYWSKETYSKPNSDKDQLYWNSLNDFDSSIIVKQLGTGWPSTNDAILKFRYQSVQEPYIDINGEPASNIIDHFAVVYDYKKKLIVDSYDGKIKEAGVYGAPIAYAIYDIEEKTTQKKLAPVTTYELHTPHKQMHITAENGAYKWSFGNAKRLTQIEKSGPTWAYNASVEVVATAHVPLEEGTAHYYMTATDLGTYMETGRVNFNIGFNHTHLAEGEPIEIIPPKPEVIVQPTIVIEDVKFISHMDNPNAYKESFYRFRETGIYQVVKSIWVKEYDGRQPDHYISAEKGERVELVGTFMRGETIYGRPYSGDYHMWFGIPMYCLEPVNENADIDEIAEQPIAEKIAARRAHVAAPVMNRSDKIMDITSYALTRPVALSEKFKKYINRRER